MPKSDRQKLKLFYIADFLMRKTDGELDENKRPLHGVLVKEIQADLEEKGITAEAHAISRDIDLLRGVKRTRPKDEDDTNEKFKEEYFDSFLDIRGGKGKPIYLGTRYLPFEDLETIVECVASANFISKPEAEKLIETLKHFCSEYQASTLTSEYIVAERPKYTERNMLKYLRKIKGAIKTNNKISFLYTRHSTKNITQTENRRKGERYIVSPYKVVLSNGNHYLIGYDDYDHQVKAYRIDRMDDVKKRDEPREGKDKFKQLGISDYAKQTFGMFIGGTANRITLQFENSLLDAMIERFGFNSGTTKYTKLDDNHFTVRTFIVESENFYGWICGLGEKVVITDPPEVAERFKDYLLKIEAHYQ